MEWICNNLPLGGSKKWLWKQHWQFFLHRTSNFFRSCLFNIHCPFTCIFDLYQEKSTAPIFFFFLHLFYILFYFFFLIHYISSPFKMSAWILRREVFTSPKPDYYSNWKDCSCPILWDLPLQFTCVDSDYINNNKNDWPLVSLINVLIYIKQV